MLKPLEVSHLKILSAKNQDFRDNKKLPSPNTPFLNFDLELTEEQQRYLQEFKITDSFDAFDNNGEIEGLEKKVYEYLHQLGKNDDRACSLIAEAISNIAKKVIAHFNQETAWITIRPFPKNPIFTLPRWHVDGRYYDLNSNVPQYKVAIALRGPSTLFYRLPIAQRDHFCELEKKGERLKLSEMIDMAKAETAPFGQGSIFIVGDNKTATVHSEPDMSKIDKPRMFFSVLPGSKAQILEYYKIQEETRAKMAMK